MSDFRIIVATTERERRDVYQLRYRIFVDELRYEIPGVSPEDGVWAATDAHAKHVIAYDGDTPAGTLTLNHWADGPLSDEMVQSYRADHFGEHLPKRSIVVVTKALVSAPYRRGLLFFQLISEAAMKALSPESPVVLIDCSPYLVSFYERLGFRRYAPHFAYGDTGIISVPLCLLMNDHLYLEQIRSPLLELARSRFRDDPSARSYFARAWGSAQRPDPEQSIEQSFEQSFILPEPTEDLDVGHCELFHEMTREEIETLLTRSKRVRFRRKSVLISSGEATAELFLVLRGFLEVTVEKGERKLAVATQGPGSVLGEMSMLTGRTRSATLTALTDGEALRIRREIVAKAVEEHPRLSSLLYRNLARILAERLRVASFWINAAPPL